ncbi:MAG: hypothetical protein K8R23_04495 [Chthoniobacter sp.]|nr:hypothetical protein [Chthoniobacter sp.]
MLTVIIGILGVACFKQHKEAEGYRQKQRERELVEAIDREIAGIRIPYEALLWDTKDFGQVAAYRLAKCRQFDMATIAGYSSVVQDHSDEVVSVNNEVDCSNASFENYWLNHYIRSCLALEGRIMGDSGEPPKAFILKERLPVIRFHVGRALKSKEQNIALASCALWLSVFPPNDDVRSRLAELVSAPKLQTNLNSEVYSRQTIEAATLIDAYDLQIPFPPDIKNENSYLFLLKRHSKR